MSRSNYLGEQTYFPKSMFPANGEREKHILPYKIERIQFYHLVIVIGIYYGEGAGIVWGGIAEGQGKCHINSQSPREGTL
jgi:hypothetical protein